jgi:hypothetical protein
MAPPGSRHHKESREANGAIDYANYYVQLNPPINEMLRLCGNAKMLTHGCSGLFFKEIGRAALLGLIFGLAVVLATGCSSKATVFINHGVPALTINWELNVLGGFPEKWCSGF